MTKSLIIKSFRQNELNRTRLIFAQAAILQPIWYWIATHYFNSSFESFNWRMTIGAIFGAYTILMPRLPLDPKKRIFYLLPAGALITIHALITACYSSWDPHHTIGAAIVVTTTFSLIISRASAWIYSFIILLTISACHLTGHGLSELLPSALWAITFVTAGMFSTYGRNLALNELLESEINSNAIVQNMTEGLIVRGSKGETLFVNAATLKIIGASIENIYTEASSIDQLQGFDQSGQPMAADAWPSKIALKTKSPVLNHPMSIKRSDGKMTNLLVTAVPVIDEFSGQVERVIVTFQDVTHMRAAENQIAIQQAAMVHSAKLTALGEMAGGIAHEINTPLTTIAANAEIIESRLRQTPINPASIQSSLERIRKTVDRIAKIIRGMRSLSSADSEERPEIVKASKIIELFKDIGQARLTNENIEFRLNLVEDFTIECTPIQISQIIINLINNAFDSLFTSEQTEKFIEVTFDKTDSEAIIVVKDNGPGIKPENRERLWQPFFTTKPVGQGLGIGLSISRKIAQNHGGDLVYSTAKGLTVFTLKIPLRKSPAATNTENDSQKKNLVA